MLHPAFCPHKPPSGLQAFLGETLLNDEFSHTVLHGDYKKNAAARNANKAPSKDPSRLGVPGGRAPPAAGTAVAPPAPASGPKPSTDPKAQSRGNCPGCGASVMTDQDRTKDDAGSYWHVECVRKNKAKVQYLDIIIDPLFFARFHQRHYYSVRRARSSSRCSTFRADCGLLSSYAAGIRDRAGPQQHSALPPIQPRPLVNSTARPLAGPGLVPRQDEREGCRRNLEE